MPEALHLTYPIETTALANGLRVVVNPDPVSPGVAVNIWYHVGSADEQPRRSGFAHLFEHLMFAGSDQVANGEHLALMQAAGASVNATTSFDRTNYFEALPKGALELALWLEADRLASLKVDQTNLDTQREVVKEEKRQRYDNVPYGDQLELLMALNFPSDHAYGHTPIGSMADIDAATLDDVQGFFSTWYRASNAVLTLSGQITAAEGFELADKYFGQLPALEAPQRKQVSPLTAHQGIPRNAVVRDVPRAAVHMGWLTPPIGHPDRLAVEQALAVLSNGQASRMHRTVVRDKDLAEGVGGWSLELAQGNSLSVISSRAREGVELARIEDEIVQGLHHLAEEGPTESELDRANATYEREWLSELSEIDSRADQLGAFATLEGDPDLMNHHLAAMLAVTPEQVREAARTWLAPEARSVLEYRIGEQTIAQNEQ